MSSMLRVGICGPANPYEFKKNLDCHQKIPNINNQAASVNAHIQSLLDLGCEVVVFTKQISDSRETLHVWGNKLHFFIVPEKGNRSDNIFRIHTIRNLKRVIDSNLLHIDILHAQWTYEFAYACIPFSNKITTFCTVRDWCPYQRRIAKRPMERCVWLVNSFLFHRVLSCPHIHFIANSEYTFNCLKKYGLRNNLSKISNGIKNKFILSTRTQYPTTPTFVSIAQNLSERRKNIITLLKAFQLMCRETTALLILVGRYDQVDYNMWKQSGLLQQVAFTGTINHDQVISLLDKCSVLVHPSIEETFGNILLEGMARRIPVIGGYNSGAVPYVLGNGKWGILCDIHDEQLLYEAMKRTIHVKEMETIINQATIHLQQNFSSDVIGKKHIELYQNTLHHELSIL